MSETKDEIEFSVVIPCYDEATRLPPTLRSVQGYLNERYEHAEIILVDDGSADGTLEFIKSEAAKDRRIRVVTYGANRGKGYAVRAGMLASRGAVSLFMDADGATCIDQVEKMLPLVQKGDADVVLGSRSVKGSQRIVSQSALRHFAGNLYGVLMRILLIHGVADTQCGFKLFNKRSCAAVFSELKNSSAIFDMELLILAAKKRFKIAEVPVIWKHDGDTRMPYNLRKSTAIIFELLRVKWRHRIVWPLRIEA